MKIKIESLRICIFEAYMLFMLINSTNYTVLFVGSVAVMFLLILIRIADKSAPIFCTEKILVKFCGSLLAMAVLWTVAAIKSNLWSYVLEYARIFIPYILNLWLMSDHQSKESIEVTEKWLYGIVTAYTMFIYATNFDNFEGIRHIQNVFTRYDRYRVNFGVGIPDIPADWCLCVMLLSILRWPKWGKKMKIAASLANTIAFIMLISTGCRAQIIAFIVMIALICFYKLSALNISYKNKKNVIVVLKWMCIIFAIFIVILNAWQTIDFEQAFIDSNRSLNFEVNIPTLLESGKIWTGICFASGGRFGEGRIGDYTLYYVDNFWLYGLMSVGIIGLMIYVYATCIATQGVIKAWKNNKQIGQNLIIILSVLLTLSISQVAFIYPTYIHCTLLWWIIFVHIIEQDKESRLKEGEVFLEKKYYLGRNK